MSKGISRPLGRWRRGSVSRLDGGGIELRIGHQRFDLLKCRVDHRDQRGKITFDLQEPTGRRYVAHYRRRWPGVILGTLIAGLIFDDEEPFNWEDRDLGLLAFNIANNTGPAKYRHELIDPSAPRTDWTVSRSISEDVLTIDSQILGQIPVRRSIDFTKLTDVSAKFDISGLHADLSVLVLREPNAVVTVPVPPSPKSSPLDWYGAKFAYWDDLLLRLRELPGWDDVADAAVRDARDYERDREPATILGMRSRSERPVWNGPAD